jgi:hypothetical protein
MDLQFLDTSSSSTKILMDWLSCRKVFAVDSNSSGAWRPKVL